MTLEMASLLAAAVTIVAALIFKKCERLRIMAIFANLLFIYWAVQMEYVPLLGLMLALLVFNLLTLRRMNRGRDATRAAADMDHSVRERIRDISAESRYSSAGIEF